MVSLWWRYRRFTKHRSVGLTKCLTKSSRSDSVRGVQIAMLASSHLMAIRPPHTLRLCLALYKNKMSLVQLINIYRDRTRILWVINTPSDAHLYLWENWKYIFPLINALVKLSSSKAFIRTNQALDHQSNWLGFGRMIWNQENNEKWTKKYREDQYADAQVTFHNTQIWAPDWNKHNETSIPPDNFVHLYNIPNDDILKEGIVISMAQRTYTNNRSVVEPALDKLLNIIPNSTLAKTSRSWGPSKGFPNQIQDINNWELKRVLENV